MAITIKQKKILGLCSMGLFLVGFSGLVWFGYQQFYAFKDSKALIPAAKLNIQLPKADSAKDMNKLEIYQLREMDSIKKLEQQAYDPYSKPVKPITEERPGFSTRHFTLGRQKEIKQQNIEARLNSIYQSIERSPEPIPSLTLPRYQTPKDTIAVPPPDPQMKQLETMLDKLIDIQHPELVRMRAKNVDSAQKQSANGLFDKSKTILAVVHQDQVLVSGGTIKLRLLQDLVAGTMKIPKGNFLYGICSIQNERLTVNLTNATYQNQVYPVSLNVYDVDGIEGIYVPGAVSREVTKDGADQAIQSFNLSTYETSIAGQAASAGIQTAKSLLSKKVRLVRVTVKAGHHILLQPANSY